MLLCSLRTQRLNGSQSSTDMYVVFALCKVNSEPVRVKAVAVLREVQVRGNEMASFPAHDRTRKTTDDDDDDEIDPVEEMIKKTGCLDKHWAVQVIK